MTAIINPTESSLVSTPDLLAAIPKSARRILAIHCGAGEIGSTLKSRQSVELTGIVSDPQAAPKQDLDHVLIGNVEEVSPNCADHSFDGILWVDQFSAERNPLRALRKVREWLHPAGWLLACIPTVRHHAAFNALLSGRWTSTTGGAMRRPLRFFTRREIEKLFFRAGWQITELRPAPNSELDAWRLQGQPGHLHLDRLTMDGLPESEAEEFHTLAYLVTATPAPRPDYGRTSIVIITFNQSPFTRQCVDSLRLRTDSPYELICIDNASTDDTAAYLRSIANAKVIVNTTNRGFPAAANQGIQAATGQQILLLNNDTILSTGWLDRQLRALHSDPRVGLVGPCSNNVSGEQQVRAHYTDDLAGLDGFAWDWGKQHHEEIVDTDRLVGFCLLIKRELVDRIGLLDERFGIGCFEDDDYCRRAVQAGFRAVIARDAFVHHFGSRTFLGSGVDFAGQLTRNRKLFQDKWAAPNTALPVAQPKPMAPAPQPAYTVYSGQHGGLFLKRRRPRISATLIVRDNVRTIGAAIRSLLPHVDEIIVLDTGSKDATPQICKDLGCKVYHFTWCDDFSAARNEVLKYATGDWIFWMDSDDVIDDVNGPKIRQVVEATTDPRIMGFFCQVRCPSDDPTDPDGFEAVDQVKLFRNRKDLRWERRLHEQILPSIRRVDGRVEKIYLFVVHAGYDRSPEGQKRKLERDERILKKELAENPNHCFTLYNLGMTYATSGRSELAVPVLRRCIPLSKGHSHLRKAYAFLVQALANLKQTDEAWKVCQEGLRELPQDAELRFRAGNLLQDMGRLPQAVRMYQSILADPEDKYIASVSQGVGGYWTRNNLAATYEKMGEWALAEEQLRIVVKEKPRYWFGWRNLGRVLLLQRKWAEALALAERMSGQSELQAERLRLTWKVAVARDGVNEALRILQDATNSRPNDPEPLRQLCDFYCEHVEVVQAEPVLWRLLQMDPQDGVALRLLGVVRRFQRRYAEAVDFLEQSLRLEPEMAETYKELGRVFQGSGRLAEAKGAWEQALRLAPDDAEAQKVLGQG